MTVHYAKVSILNLLILFYFVGSKLPLSSQLTPSFYLTQLLYKSKDCSQLKNYLICGCLIQIH